MQSYRSSHLDTLEYYYALASPWSYLGNDRLRASADEFGFSIDPIIIDYDVMFEAAGTVPLPQRPRLRKEYRLVDLARWAAFRDVPINVEPKFYQGEVEEPNERDGALMVVAAKLEGMDSLKLAHAISRALWAEERFPFVEAELIDIANSEGFDGAALWTRAHEADVAEKYEEDTRKSVERGVFGMPFYILRGAPYWGQDRLELLAHHAAESVTPSANSSDT